MQFSRDVSEDSRLRRMGMVTARDQSAVLERINQLAGLHVQKELTEEQLADKMAHKKIAERLAAGTDGGVQTDHPLWCLASFTSCA